MSAQLAQAAQAVIDRWDSPQWEWTKQGPTADLIADLRKALAAFEAAPQQAQAPFTHAVATTTTGRPGITVYDLGPSLNPDSAITAKLIEMGWAPPSKKSQAPKAVCMDQFCACRGGPCASCEEGDREAELASLRSSLEFYKRRCDLLQQWQSKMRDPERVLVCDILANGQTLPESTGRYALPEAQQAQAPGWQLVPVEPTPEMKKAAVVYANGNAVYKNVAREALEIEESIYGEVYAAMLSAAPQQGSKS